MKFPSLHSRPPRLLALALALSTWSLLTAVDAAQSTARIWNEELMSGIRLNVPNPPAHARNLFHTAVAMYDCWAAYDVTAVGYVSNEKITPLPADIEAARNEAISYAAYRVERTRLGVAPPAPNTDNSGLIKAALDARIIALYGSGADTTGQGALVAGSMIPSEVGKRIGQAILSWSASDGFSQTAYPQAYNSAVNGNMAISLDALGQIIDPNGNILTDKPLGYGIPSNTDPNLWQPLALSSFVSQNGLPTPGGIQSFVGVQSLATTPFALTRTDALKPWLDPHNGPSKVSTPSLTSATDAAYKQQVLAVIRASSQLNDNTIIDFSPGTIGNSPLGTDAGTGSALNPVTNAPYASNTGKRGDYVRCLAEFWADGPKSETPPGHWHVLANEVADDPLVVKKIKGVGPTVSDLEWDVKVYFALAASVHDAACCAWSLKRYYSGPRPITLIRWLCTNGQSTDPVGPSYSPYGIPLETDVCEVITAATAAPGGKHESIWDVNSNSFRNAAAYTDYLGNPHTMIGQIAIKSWPGEHPSNAPAPSIATNQSLVTWMLGKDWLPFQRKTFNTPAFPGYVSGHSSFSRAAAEVLTRITGSADFPGGFHHHTIAANSLQIDLGPSAAIDLQWRNYYDAADQAGQSRRFGGIHVSEDDYHGREIGSAAGIGAFNLAEKYWTGAIQNENMRPNVKVINATTATLTWTPVRGMKHIVQTSSDLITWFDAYTPAKQAYNNDAADGVGVTNGPDGYDRTWTDTAANVTKKFYRIKRTNP